jgi:transposase
MSQKKADFIKSCENALHFYKGVPKAIVTDNLKSAVTKSHRYEPRLNPDFEDFAEHYQVAVLPARAYKPKDKALVEGAVKIVYQQVYARIRNQVFHQLEDLNKALWSMLENLNNRKLSGRPYSRREFFVEVEQDTLASLPVERFEIRNYIQVTVLQNGHVSLKEDKHYYSVPYQYIRKKVRVSYTSKEVKVYYNYHCIAEHQRVRSPYNYTTNPDHLASKHKQYTKWNAGYFLKWAESIDPKVMSLITQILEKKQHPEQAYRSCIGVLSLNKKVGTVRFVNACSLAIAFEQYSYISLLNILDRGLDRLEQSEDLSPLPVHQNIRGKSYYKSNKTKDNE